MGGFCASKNVLYRIPKFNRKNAQKSADFVEVVLNRLTNGGHCSMAVGDGISLNVDCELATAALALLDDLDKKGIELDVEDSVNRKINLYYQH
jgi:hypothetical protein